MATRQLTHVWLQHAAAVQQGHLKQDQTLNSRPQAESHGMHVWDRCGDCERGRAFIAFQVSSIGRLLSTLCW